MFVAESGLIPKYFSKLWLTKVMEYVTIPLFLLDKKLCTAPSGTPIKKPSSNKSFMVNCDVGFFIRQHGKEQPNLELAAVLWILHILVVCYLILCILGHLACRN